MYRRLDSETSVNKPFENVSCQGHIQNFFKGEGTNFRHFFKRRFFARVNFNKLKYQNDSRGCGGMLPQKIFENLHIVMTILVLFKQFLGKACHICGPEF